MEYFNGVVNEKTQRNDLDIVREVLKVTKEVPIEHAYDFSFAKEAEPYRLSLAGRDDNPKRASSAIARIL